MQVSTPKLGNVDSTRATTAVVGAEHTVQSFLSPPRPGCTTLQHSVALHLPDSGFISRSF